MTKRKPRTWTVANLKGGVSKTTTTLNVAAVLRSQGNDVMVVDGDPQGTAIEWAAEGSENGLPLSHDVVEMARADMLDHLDGVVGDGQWLVIDVGPGNADISAAAIAAADLVVIPQNNRMTDVRQTIKAALQCEQLGVDYRVLITRVKGNESTAPVRGELVFEDGRPLKVLVTAVPDLVDFDRFGSTVPGEGHAYVDVVAELLAVR